jgi:hypothetical protein
MRFFNTCFWKKKKKKKQKAKWIVPSWPHDAVAHSWFLELHKIEYVSHKVYLLMLCVGSQSFPCPKTRTTFICNWIHLLCLFHVFYCCVFKSLFMWIQYKSFIKICRLSRKCVTIYIIFILVDWHSISMGYDYLEFRKSSIWDVANDPKSQLVLVSTNVIIKYLLSSEDRINILLIISQEELSFFFNSKALKK